MSRALADATAGRVSPGAATDKSAAASMFTVCPKCALTLVVTAADLRVAQGYVRCGRCSSVFNALARLSERQAAEVTESAPAAAPTGEAAAAPARAPEAALPTPPPAPP